MTRQRPRFLNVLGACAAALSLSACLATTPPPAQPTTDLPGYAARAAAALVRDLPGTGPVAVQPHAFTPSGGSGHPRLGRVLAGHVADALAARGLHLLQGDLGGGAGVPQRGATLRLVGRYTLAEHSAFVSARLVSRDSGTTVAAHQDRLAISRDLARIAGRALPRTGPLIPDFDARFNHSMCCSLLPRFQQN